jgi:hypothetical protein
MYVLMVAALFVVFPLASIVIETLVSHHGMPAVSVVGKWLVFWAVGIRLLLAGVRQIVQPRYTAETILGIKGTDALLVVRELGIANTAIGSLGVGSIWFPAWVLPTALAGTIFYGLAGINHVTHKNRNKLENIAMMSDLLMAMVLLAFCMVTMAH